MNFSKILLAIQKLGKAAPVLLEILARLAPLFADGGQPVKGCPISAHLAEAKRLVEESQGR